MSVAVENLLNPSFMSQHEVPATVPEQLDRNERDLLKDRIKHLLKSQGAVLIAHYYTDSNIQALAEETGGYVSDSLDMARFGHEHSANTLIIAGVRFMGETAKILNPEKRVLMPDLKANCSLDLGCPIDEFSQFCDAHPDRTVVVYSNTSAAVKARADWVVTSGSAVDIVNHLKNQGEKILWAPDKYLGAYVRDTTGADMLLWNGACIVHEEFKGFELVELRKKYPDAKVLVHPESPEHVIVQADYVGSTTGLIKAAQTMNAKRFIVATDGGIFYKMQQAAPDKELILAPTAGKSATCKSCGHCPWMAMNGLRSLLHCLESNCNEVLIDSKLGERAKLPIQRLLDFTAARNQVVLGAHDA